MSSEDLFAPYGKFLWDPWFIQRGKEYHAFYLQMPRTSDPQKRNQIPLTIGHAVSADLRTWQELPTALSPSPAGTAWDDFSLSAGSILEKDATYYLFYTGKNTQIGHANTQKICLATATDLTNWTKYSTNPLIETDTKHYDSSGLIFKGGVSGAWRDPFAFVDPHTGKYFLTISARSKELTVQHDACVALAESDDLLHWTVLPPIFSPSRYEMIDRTQIVYHNNHYYLFFTTHSKNYEPIFARQHGVHEGLHCYYSRELTSGYKPINGTGAVFPNGNELCDVRILPGRNGEFIGLGWQQHDKDGHFVGKLAAPVTFRIRDDQIYVIG